MALPVHPGDSLPWALGFRDVNGKYLTVENFGHRLNINGGSMKTKQIFQIEQDEGAGSKVFIRTPHGRYLTAKPDGTWAADAETRGTNEEFEIEVQPDGRWALKSAHGYYCGGAGEKIDAFTKEVAEDRLFIVNLAMHPQVCIWNVNRKTYLHLEGEVINADEPIPWGADATITLTFFDSTGKYGLQACDGRFLKSDGTLTTVDTDPTIQYTLDMFGGQMAFRASNNMYLTCLGGKGTCRATKQGPPGKDELFVLEDSHPQIKMTSWQGKKVSVRSSVEATANQTDTTDAERFQIEIDDSGKWNIRTNKNTFWYTSEDGTIMTDGASKNAANSKFTIEWLNDSIALKASSGKFVSVKKNGGLVAKDADIAAESTFVYELINRPLLVLRGQHGFIATTDKSKQLMSTSAKAFTYNMHVKAGVCHISDPTKDFWNVASDASAVTVDGKQPTKFFLEFVGLSKIALKHMSEDGSSAYLRSHQNGSVTVDGDKVDASTTFEF
ncbi:fascin 2A [Salpingoeca rosetta]|uniref:Fascin n=1 Tax=Salpingoeca rosetta (strain ATCC 50818 / BSB-021) TaxID=946362 RepID=F2UAZ6_SALR5|nr:fascin 2A, variant [Salpingoeca rosetta]XP_012493088.1 fascin 2A [Salpingoeca rosetta]EGD74009.1 fascin 2A, variant [Salpingoeca rosetta]EGD74010.1 fascin 2A [Salpingoeca rosetta]|eukprot:XP_004993572.1 fascin 2A, variant [Salpingoeca rosetta]